jgi:hypothetical protein
MKGGLILHILHIHYFVIGVKLAKLIELECLDLMLG